MAYIGAYTGAAGRPSHMGDPYRISELPSDIINRNKVNANLSKERRVRRQQLERVIKGEVERKRLEQRNQDEKRRLREIAGAPYRQDTSDIQRVGRGRRQSTFDAYRARAALGMHGHDPREGNLDDDTKERNLDDEAKQRQKDRKEGSDSSLVIQQAILHPRGTPPTSPNRSPNRSRATSPNSTSRPQDTKKNVSSTIIGKGPSSDATRLSIVLMFLRGALNKVISEKKEITRERDALAEERVKERDVLAEERQTHQVQVQARDEILEDQQAKLRAQQSEIDKLTTVATNHKEQDEKLTLAMEVGKVQKAALRQAKGTVKQLQGKLQDLQNQLNASKLESASLKEEASILKSDLQSLQNNAKEQEKQCEQLSKSQQQISDKYNSLYKINLESYGKIGSQNRLLSNKEMAIQLLHIRIETLEQEIETLQQQLAANTPATTVSVSASTETEPGVSVGVQGSPDNTVASTQTGVATRTVCTQLGDPQELTDDYMSRYRVPHPRYGRDPKRNFAATVIDLLLGIAGPEDMNDPSQPSLKLEKSDTFIGAMRENVSNALRRLLGHFTRVH